MFFYFLRNANTSVIQLVLNDIYNLLFKFRQTIAILDLGKIEKFKEFWIIRILLNLKN